MATIQVSPDILDKALAVLVDEPRSVLAVWKGRARVDLYDVAGTWHETMQAFPRDEEGMWSRDDVRDLMEEALATAAPPRVRVAASGPTLRIDADALRSAALVRASSLGYALWNGGDALVLHAADGTELRAVRMPPSDLSTMSNLMLDLLALCDTLAAVDNERQPADRSGDDTGTGTPGTGTSITPNTASGSTGTRSTALKGAVERKTARSPALEASRAAHPSGSARLPAGA